MTNFCKNISPFSNQYMRWSVVGLVAGSFLSYTFRAILNPYAASTAGGVHGMTSKLSRCFLSCIFDEAELKNNPVVNSLPGACGLLAGATTYLAMQLIPQARAIAIYSIALSVLPGLINFVTSLKSNAEEFKSYREFRELDVSNLKEENIFNKLLFVLRTNPKLLGIFYEFLIIKECDKYSCSTPDRLLPSVQERLKAASTKAEDWTVRNKVITDFFLSPENADFTDLFIQTLRTAKMKKSEKQTLVLKYCPEKLEHLSHKI